MVSDRAYLKSARQGAGLNAVRAEVGRLMAGFATNGAKTVEPAALLPADILIDLYGEDLRARAYTTHDPVLGEQMLRPDFTVPVAQMHMQSGAEAGRYAYAGSVWRRQQPGSSRPTEYLQCGFEAFGEADTARADAEVFALLAEALRDAPVQPATGDMGIVLAGIQALETSPPRKAALMRHLWRPERFKRLLERYASSPQPSKSRLALLKSATAGNLDSFLAEQGPAIGLRSLAEIKARAAILLEDSATPAIPAAQVALLERALTVSAPMEEAIKTLRAIAADMPALTPAIDLIEARATAMSGFGIDGFQLPFEASYGRTTLEYYNGFVFGFAAENRPDLPQIAQGGRYDALTTALGRSVPAVGGIIRPEALLSLNGDRP
ncbi:MAG: ATP phosphoribosyltransferase regulatory subunit [Rhodobacteraceae bacterium]|nr:ATP phosphoribosyltransferase regulatory subunit [Paracoccaceae bacterium]